MMNDKNRINFIEEDDSEAWSYHLEQEERQRLETEPRMDTREILERLRKAGAILDVCDARLEHLTFMINETVKYFFPEIKERIEKSDLKFRESLRKKANHLK